MKTGILRAGWSARVEEYPVGAGFSADESQAFVLDASGALTAFDARSGAVRWRVGGRPGGAGIALAVGRNRLATSAQDGSVFIRELERGAVVSTYEAARGGGAWVEHLAWSPDGRSLAATVGRSVCVWSDEGSAWRTPEHGSTVGGLAVTETGRVVSACAGRIFCWTVGTNEPTRTIEFAGAPAALVVSPSGIIACSSHDRSVRFWRPGASHESLMSGYATKPTALAFDASSTLLATSGGETITVWSFAGDGPEGTRPGQLSLHALPVTALRFGHRDRSLASGGRDGGVVVWRLAADGTGTAVGAALAHGPVTVLAWRADDRALLATDAEGGVTVWRVAT
jgi:WD40 repeat protein